MVAINWTIIITPSRYGWERRALDFIRASFPTHDPYRAWANCEFQAADGAILFCPGLWVLVAEDEQSELPLLDGQAIPLLTPGQYARAAGVAGERASRYGSGREKIGRGRNA